MFSTKPGGKVNSEDYPKLPQHYSRNLLWATDDSQNDTYFSPLTMCPAYINQTESARLLLELERYHMFCSLKAVIFKKNQNLLGGLVNLRYPSQLHKFKSNLQISDWKLDEKKCVWILHWRKSESDRKTTSKTKFRCLIPNRISCTRSFTQQ